MQRLIVLSDLHIAPPGPLDSFHSGPALAACIASLAAPGTTLVLAGDVFDFLQLDDRPPALDLDAVPALLGALLDTIGTCDWGQALWRALAALLDAGGELVVLPGNHDPELLHPVTAQLLGAALGRPDHPRLHVHRSDDPWRTALGRWQVVVGHGHRGDAWNDIAPEAIHTALDRGGLVRLPPGSQLVLEVINAFKRERRPDGSPRFPFVDLLKPETPAVPLLLLYLDPCLALTHLEPALSLGARTLARAVRRRLFGGPALAAPSTSAATEPAAAERLVAVTAGDGETRGEAVAEWLAELVVAEMAAGERSAPAAAQDHVEAWLAGQTGREPAAEGLLATHSGAGRWLLRAFLRRASYGATFFDRHALGEEDRRIIAKELPEHSGPRVVIAGHTHAAREHVLSGERIYLNTGTWSDLMALPPLEDTAAVRAFVDALEAGTVERRRHLTYAEVTAAGARLLEWPAR